MATPVVGGEESADDDDGGAYDDEEQEGDDGSYDDVSDEDHAAQAESNPEDGVDLDADIEQGESIGDLSVLSPNTPHRFHHTVSGAADNETSLTRLEAASSPQPRPAVNRPGTTEAVARAVELPPVQEADDAGLSSAEEGSLGGYSDDDDNDE